MESGNLPAVCKAARPSRGRKLLSVLILGLSLPVIILLAIPACLLIAAIAAIWSLADEALKRLDA